VDEPVAAMGAQHADAQRPVAVVPPLTPVTRELPTVPIAHQVPGVTAEARSPWSAVADGGVVIGRKSKDAGVATAGFFTRFGRRVAGAF
jgi:hypothetical protein